MTAFNENEMDKLVPFAAEGVSHTIHGHASENRTYQGRPATGDVLRRIKELTAGSIVTKPEVMLAEGGAVMAYTHVTGSRPDGRTYDERQASLNRMRDGQLIEGETIPVDQQAFAEFFAD